MKWNGHKLNPRHLDHKSDIPVCATSDWECLISEGVLWTSNATVLHNMLCVSCEFRAFRRQRRQLAPLHYRRHLVTMLSEQRRGLKSKSTLQFQVRQIQTQILLARLAQLIK